MPKIDWNPGRGRRGRPLRRVLGMGQQQGLLVMYGIAAVAVLFAVAAAFGVFDGSSPQSAGGAANTAADGSGGGTGSQAAPKDSSKSQILLASVRHYADLMASGQKIVGHTHYAGIAAYAQAFSDPKSPAAQFAKFRAVPNPEGDTTYLDAARQAAAASNGHRGGALDQWTNDMAQAKSDLGDWITTAVRYQQGAATQADLDSAAATVTQDLAKAESAASSLGS